MLGSSLSGIYVVQILEQEKKCEIPTFFPLMIIRFLGTRCDLRDGVKSHLSIRFVHSPAASADWNHNEKTDHPVRVRAEFTGYDILTEHCHLNRVRASVYLKLPRSSPPTWPARPEPAVGTPAFLQIDAVPHDLTLSRVRP